MAHRIPGSVARTVRRNEDTIGRYGFSMDEIDEALDSGVRLDEAGLQLRIMPGFGVAFVQPVADLGM